MSEIIEGFKKLYNHNENKIKTEHNTNYKINERKHGLYNK